MRVRAGMGLNEASDKLGWKRGRLNRFEANQWRQPDPSHVRDLARIYGANGGEREDLEDLVARARALATAMARAGSGGAAAPPADPRPRRRHCAAAGRSDHRGVAAVPLG